MAAVLATAASPSPLASDERADERVDSRLTRSSSSDMLSYWVAETAAIRAKNFILVREKLSFFEYIIIKLDFICEMLADNGVIPKTLEAKENAVKYYAYMDCL